MENIDKKVQQLKLDEILPNRFQPRIKFEEKAITELAESIKEHGVIQPIVVRPIGDRYEIIAGERRYKASVMAGKNDIPAIVVALDDKESAEIALIENVQRQDLTPIEEAISYKKILDMGYLTQQQLALKLGKSQASIANKMRLLNLHEDVQEALLNEKISERHARSLLKLEPKDQKNLLKRIIDERLTVRKTDEEISKIKGNNKKPKLEIINFEQEKEEKDMNENNQNEVLLNNQEEQTTNPGFMDINKIEQTASDIFNQTPTAPVEDLLTPTELPKQETNVSEDQDTPLVNGRFFNLLNDEQPTQDMPENFVQPVNDNQVVDNFYQDMPKDEVSPTVLEETSAVDMLEPTTPIVETPVESVSEETNEIDMMEPATPVLETNEPIKEEELTPITPVNLDSGEIIEEKPVVMPAIEEIEEVDIPSLNIEPVITEKPVIEKEPTVSITPPTNTYVAGDLKTVINTIRNCADTIEKYGYQVDLDEIDLEDTYQVVFKVSKHNK